MYAVDINNLISLMFVSCYNSVVRGRFFLGGDREETERSSVNCKICWKSLVVDHESL